jgi:hypothetical protein
MELFARTSSGERTLLWSARIRSSPGVIGFETFTIL